MREYDSMDDDRSTTASSVTLGTSTDFGGVTGFVTGAGTAAHGDADYWAITVGIRAPL
jgi:hypothetical protein